jgi:hypothetical protein
MVEVEVGVEGMVEGMVKGIVEVGVGVVVGVEDDVEVEVEGEVVVEGMVGGDVVVGVELVVSVDLKSITIKEIKMDIPDNVLDELTNFCIDRTKEYGVNGCIIHLIGEEENFCSMQKVSPRDMLNTIDVSIKAFIEHASLAAAMSMISNILARHMKSDNNDENKNLITDYLEKEGKDVIH